MSTYGASTIVQEVISAANQNAVKLLGSAIARPLLIPSNWNKIRVGIRWLFSNFAANASGIPGPIFAAGLCHGTANLFSDASTGNFVGVVSDGAWTYQVSEVLLDFITIKAATRVGTTTTLSAALNNGTFQYGQGTSPPWSPTPQLFFVDITKGSPNFTVNSFYINNGQSAGIQTASTFLSLVVDPAPALANMVTGTAKTIAVDEANGTLDTVSVSWNRTDFWPEICDLAVVVLS